MLRTGPNDDTGWTVVRCPDSGPAALASLWLRRETRTPAASIALRDASRHMRDGRVFDAVMTVVHAPSYPTQERLAALSVLLRYYDGSYMPIDSAFGDGSAARMLPQSTHGASDFRGTRPVADDVRVRIATELAAIATSDSDSTFRRVASAVRQALAFADPVNTPVSAGAITLVAGCGRRVTVRSTADIALPIHVGVLGTTSIYRKGIARGAATRPAELPLAFPPGVVVATLGGREIARLTERNAPCRSDQVR